MKLAPKLLAAPLATALIVLTVGQVNTFQQQAGLKESEAAFRSSLGTFKTVVTIEKNVGELHANIYRTVAVIGSMDESAIQAFRSKLKKQVAEGQVAIKQLASQHVGHPELDKAAQQAGAQLDKYVQQADQAIDLSSIDPNTGIAALQSADSSFSELTKSIGQMVTLINSDAEAEAAEAAARSYRNGIALALLGLLVAAGAVGMSWWMQRRMVRDLKKACEVANNVAQGQLNSVSDVDREDELGDLMHSLSHMIGELNRSIRTVQESSQSIHIASVEIASGNNDLSNRTEQAASNLQETASSMQNLTITVEQSAHAASEANQLAQAAAAVANRGGQVVAQVVSTMQDISASSKRIGDIIGTIDAIAFQTNILALNAAVEAARAGEQGRGFAVVAGEVRSLAQRSASAAQEIKLLIGSSVERVESGARLVADAGSTMEEIVTSVKRVSDIVAEISSSSTEQSSGIGQVNSAVGSLEQVTQQNAALVEQSAAAAESLKEQAGRLGEVVARFELGTPTQH
jgi:methyl-accepting chemotaxis protein